MPPIFGCKPAFNDIDGGGAVLAGMTNSLELVLRHRLQVEVQREEICR